MSQELINQSEHRHKKIGKIIGLILMALIILFLFFPLFTFSDVPLGADNSSGVSFTLNSSDAYDNPHKELDIQIKAAKNTKTNSKSGIPLKTDPNSKEVLSNNFNEEKENAPITANDSNSSIDDYEEAKDKYSNVLKEALNKKDRKGDKDDQTENSLGPGSLGGGLQNRSGKGPRIDDDFQEQGTILIRVCVAGDGEVLKAEYQLKGSNSQNDDLIAIALKNAKSWTFAKSDLDKQCGTITYNFKVR